MKRVRLAIHPLGACEPMLSAVRRSLLALPPGGWTPQLEEATAGPAEVALWLVEGAAWPQACAALCEARASQPLTVHLVVLSQVPSGGVEQLMAHGAFDFLHHPFSDEEMALRLKRALGAVPAPVPLSAAALPDIPACKALIGTSPAFVRQTRRLGLMAGCDAGVLILGETGTGKEVFAQAIHYASARAGGPWVAINCGAIPLELMESELFGHVRGAFTHAHATRQGLVAEAAGGTLFLDEIDALPVGAQSKLLRFLQEKEYRPVGGDTVRQADVRIIAASNRDLERAVARGQFRQDLFFRLNVLNLHLPPLRERREDIPALAQHFFQQAGRDLPRRATGISPLAMRRLVEHAWPGNVRELEHVIQRAVLLCEGPCLQAGDIEFDGEATAIPTSDESFQAAKARVVERFERSYIERLLQASEGNISHAARIAKKNRRAFFELIRKHAIDADRFRMSLT